MICKEEECENVLGHRNKRGYCLIHVNYNSCKCGNMKTTISKRCQHCHFKGRLKSLSKIQSRLNKREKENEKIYNNRRG